VLVHETGHMLGLPDLYLFDKHDWHRGVGGWDPMGWLPPGSPFLVWHRFKFGWLTEDHAAVVRPGASGSFELTSVDTPEGLKAVVLPIGEHQAYVLEARRRGDAEPAHDPLGLLLYRVDATMTTGHGPIQVIPARPDDDQPELKARFQRLYQALYFEGVVLDDGEHKVKVVVEQRREDGYRVRVER
jgi:hypothetical protein